MKHPFFVRCADAVFLSRPLLWIPVWGFCVFGYLAGLRTTAGSYFISSGWHAPLQTCWWIFVFSFSVGAVYVFNQIADRAVDAENAGFPLLAKGNIPVRLAWVSFAALALASVLTPLAGRPGLAFFSLSALGVGFVYSSKPFCFSGRPVVDFLANAVGYGFIAFGAGWYLSGASFTGEFLIRSLPYFFLMCAGSISSTLPDSGGDRAHGKRTTAVWLGDVAAHRIACICILAGLASALVARDWAAATCAGCAVPLYLAHAMRNSAKSMEATYKIGGMILMVAAAVMFPMLVPASLVCLVATMAYFRLRFHVRYPSLVPDAPRR